MFKILSEITNFTPNLTEEDDIEAAINIIDDLLEKISESF